MPKFKAKVIPVGTHQTRKGALPVDAARNKRWSETFRRMKVAGIKVPAAWGHQPKAEPADDEKAKADREYWISRFNAGYIDDLDVESDGTLSAVIDAPGVEIDEQGRAVATARLPDGKEVKCAISEVSAAIRDWKDGKGNVWPDSIIHIALTPWPVVGGQTGFKPVPSAEPAEGEMHLSLTTLLADPPAEGGKPPEEPEVPEGKGEGDGEGEGGEEGDEEGVNKEADFQTMLDLLARVVNIHLPEGTMPENFHERLTTILHHEDQSAGGGEPAEGGGAGGQDQPGGAATPPGTESPPMLMSLSDVKDPVAKALFLDKQESLKARRKARIAALARRKWPGGNTPCLPPAEIQDMVKLADGYELSLHPDGKVVETDLDKKLDYLERILPAPSAGDWKDGAAELNNPLDAAENHGKPDPEFVQEQIAKAGLRSYAKAGRNGSK